MWLIRWILGKIILFLNAVFPARPEIKRAPEEQARVDRECESLSLYQFEACPFCVKVRRAMSRMGLKIATRDAHGDPRALEELLAGGGKRQVPCLKILDGGGEAGGSVRWLYESDDIIAYLQSRFAH